MPDSSLTRRQALQLGGASVLTARFAGRLPAAVARPTRKILYFTKSVGFQHSVIARRNGQLSHSEKILIELGKNHGVERLDEVTLIGPEDGLRPQDLARITGRSRYESFNIHARVPKVVVGT